VVRIVRFVLTLVLMISIGAQWAVLQSAAWLGMAVSYSIRAGSVVDGLGKTFDGRHPCALCRAVEKGSRDGKRKSSLPGEKMAKQKLHLLSALSLAMPTASSRQEHPAWIGILPERTLKPAIPPPIVG
jgi:hypothetical protein